MYLMYYLDENNVRQYTLAKTDPGLTDLLIGFPVVFTGLAFALYLFSVVSRIFKKRR